jgi:threonine dehydrogenase-like Zn-dependent dehydrogenase
MAMQAGEASTDVIIIGAGPMGLFVRVSALARQAKGAFRLQKLLKVA